MPRPFPPNWPLLHRSIRTTTHTRRNVLARYAPPPIATSLGRVRYADHEGDGFLSESTVPVSASIQAVPPPSSSSAASGPNTGAEVHETLPAMKPLSPSPPSSSSLPSSTSTPPSTSLDLEKEPIQTTFLGMEVPVKPRPPGEEECCMSGCVNCIYTLYTDSLLAYHDHLAQFTSELRRRGIPWVTWPIAVRGSGVGREDDGNGNDGAVGGDGDEGNGGNGGDKKGRREVERQVMQDLDPSLRAFLEMEARLRAKKEVREMSEGARS